MRNTAIDKKYQNSVRIATIIGVISVTLNILLGSSKIVAGRMLGSNAVFSDGVHGTGDVLTTLIAIISVWIAARKRNAKYNYGHEKWSDIACIILATILFVTAGTILVESIQNIVAVATSSGSSDESTLFGSTLWWVCMGLAIASVIVKEIMFYITWYGGKKAHSSAMKLDAWHQRIDALSSVAAIIGLMGYYWMPEKNLLDPIFSLPIVFMIVGIGVSTFRKAAHELTDHAIPEEKMKEVRATVLTLIPEAALKTIHSRMYSEKFYLDIYLLQDPNQNLKEASALSDCIRQTLFAKFDDLKDIYVIVEPNDEEHRTQEETER